MNKLYNLKNGDKNNTRYDAREPSGKSTGYREVYGRRQLKPAPAKRGIMLWMIRISIYNTVYRFNDEIRPISYQGYSIYFIRDSVFFYAVLCNGVAYMFDIRPAYENMGLGCIEEETWDIINHQEEWMCETVGRIEQSDFYLDFEKSVNKCNESKFGNRK